MRRPLRALVVGALSIMTAVVPPAAAPAAAASGIVMYADSGPGDTLAPGLTRVYASGGVSARDDAGTVVEGQASGDPGDTWFIQFRAPTGQALTAGTTYTNIASTPTATRASLIMQNPTYEECAPAASTQFTVHEITATTFAASIVFTCKGASGSFFGYFGTPDAATDVIALLASPPSVTFPDTPVGDTSSTIPVTIASSGSIAAHITTVQLRPGGEDDFSIDSETCTGAPLAPGSSCVVNVAFVPSVSGTHATEIDIRDDTLRGFRTVPIAGTGTATSSAVGWGPRRTASPKYRWSWGFGLARTETSSTAYLHTIAMTDRINGAWAADTGPYVGVMYARGNESGSRWGTPYRVNPAKQHGERAAIATSGRYVYTTWVRLLKWVHYKPKAHRTLYVRRNTNHGAAGAWSARLALTSTRGRVDRPQIAASGPSVYVVYTDGGTGSVRVAISHDHGATWNKVTVGTTSRSTTEGKAGLPSISVDGSSVVVTWLRDDLGQILARVSTNDGSTWSAPEQLWSEANAGAPASAARDGTLAVAWTTPEGARLRTWSGGVWSVVRKIGAPYGSRAYLHHWSAAVALGGDGHVGVAWSACWASCGVGSKKDRVDLVWAESEDGGVTWFRSQVVADSFGAAPRRVNDAAAVVWPTPTNRIVLYNGWTPGTLDYRMYLRSGAGTP